MNPWDDLRAEAKEAGVPFLAEIGNIPDEIISHVTASQARRLRLIPISRAGKTLQVAGRDPFNFVALDSLDRETGFTSEQVMVPEGEIDRCLKAFYAIGDKE